MEASEDLSVGFVGYGHSLTSGGQQIEPHSRLLLKKGAVLAVEPDREGMRAYLSFCGGMDRIDGLSVGATIKPVGSARLATPKKLAQGPGTWGTGELRVVGGSELGNATAVLTAQMDRVGLRLDTGSDERPRGDSKSVPTVFGAVQRTPNGGLLIHGPDGPTIGGYDLLGVVASIDLPKLGQLRPGQAVTFREVSLQESRRLAIGQSAEFESLLRRVVLASR